MKRLTPLAFLVLVMAGCHSKPVVSQREHRENTAQSLAYSDFVARRTLELQRMGGPFADKQLARQKAAAEADSQFGGAPATYETNWAWGKNAGKAQAQAEFNESLDKMAKEQRN